MYLTETPLAQEQKIQHRKGDWQITAKVRDTWQLHFWIMSQGASITVLSPKELCNRIKREHESAAKAYQ